MTKKNLFISLNNIDAALKNAIEKRFEQLDLQTIHLELKSLTDNSDIALIKVEACEKNPSACHDIKEFFEEYRLLNQNIQHLAFGYMKATNSFIEFDYGHCT